MHRISIFYYDTVFLLDKDFGVWVGALTFVLHLKLNNSIHNYSPVLIMNLLK